MAETLTTPPTVEPISLEEAKLQARIDVEDEDERVEAYIGAAREWIEAITGRALIDQVWTLTLDALPEGGVIVLPRPPLRSVTSVAYIDAAGVSQAWAATTGYQVQIPGGPYAERGRIAPAYGTSVPALRSGTFNALTVVFRAGYGVDGTMVPKPLRHAIALLVAHMFNNRDAVVPAGLTGFQELPLGIKALIAPYINRSTC